jgi:hypothetical protein
LPKLVKEAELVVRALVVSSRPHLSADGVSIFSDYTMQVLDEILSRKGPIQKQTIVVSEPGGTLTIDGHKVFAWDPQFPPMEPGDEYILFLRRNADGEYGVAYGSQGAFRNIGGLVEQVQDGDWNREHGKMPVSQFRQQIGDAASSK